MPRTEIFYFVPAWTEPLFKHVEFHSAKIIPLKMQTPGDWIATFKKMRSLKVDAILELSQAGRTGVFFDIYSSLFRIPYFFHNHHSKVGVVRDQGVQKAIIQRDLDAAWTYFGWLQKVPVPNYLDYPPKLNVMERAKYKRVILGVVATRETKMYPLEKYAAIARLIKAQDYSIEVVATLSNSDEDKIIADKIAALRSPIQVVVKPLQELPLYFKESSLYIGNDTGLKHLAIAMDLPTVTLFGPEPPIEWHPYDKKLHPYFFRHPLPCRYEKGTTYCPLSKCSSMICLSEIAPEGIWEKAKVLMGGNTSSYGSSSEFTNTGYTLSSFNNTGSLPLSEDLEKTVVLPVEPLKPIELDRTNITIDKNTALDLGQKTMVTQIKKEEED